MQRPTMEELMLGEKMGRIEEEEPQETTTPENKLKGLQSQLKLALISAPFLH